MAGYLKKIRGNKSSYRAGATISRRLKSAGWDVSSAAQRGRNNGIFVSAQRDNVSILVDLGIPAKNLRVINQIAAEIVQWDCVPDAVDVTQLPGHDVYYIDFLYRRDVQPEQPLVATGGTWEQLQLW